MLGLTSALICLEFELAGVMMEGEGYGGGSIGTTVLGGGSNCNLM